MGLLWFYNGYNMETSWFYVIANLTRGWCVFSKPGFCCEANPREQHNNMSTWAQPVPSPYFRYLHVWCTSPCVTIHQSYPLALQDVISQASNLQEAPIFLLVIYIRYWGQAVAWCFSPCPHDSGWYVCWFMKPSHFRYIYHTSYAMLCYLSNNLHRERTSPCTEGRSSTRIWRVSTQFL